MGTENPTEPKYDALISYRRQDPDKAFARDLLKKLDGRGLKVAFDERDFSPPEHFLEEMERCVRQCRFMLCVISPRYLQSGNCMEEANICKTLDMGERRRRMLPLVIEDAPMPVWMYGLTSIRFDDPDPLVDPYERLYQTLGKPGRPTVVQPAVTTAEVFFASAWPQTEGILFGREQEVAGLDRAWDDQQTFVVSYVAAGGIGKTALVDYWLNHHLLPDGWRGAERVFGWSFYSQGSAEGRQASGDQFIDKALRWFGDQQMADSPRSGWDKGQRLAELVQGHRTLLLLDGLEPLQAPPGSPNAGQITDPAVQTLLRSLARGNPGLCVVSTRVDVHDLKAFKGVSTEAVDLDILTPEAGAAYLRELGVKGPNEELEKACREVAGHALALTLLGRYVAVVFDGDIRKRDRLDHIPTEDRVGRIITWYERRLENSPELDILRMLGLFDRPAEQAAIDALRAEPAIAGITDRIVGLSQPNWKFALKNLRDFRLISRDIGAELDCHPLLREHFARQLNAANPAAWREAHNRLYEHYKAVPEKHQPDTIEELTPLYRAVTHGCHAGRHQEAVDEVLWERILRGDEFYSIKKLGALGADLAALAGLFDPPWGRPVHGLTETEKGFVLNWAGFRLRGLGRLAEAARPMEGGMDASIAQGDWKGAAVDAANLSELVLTLGEVDRALEYARRGVEYADKSGDAFQRMTTRTALADALHQAGRPDEAEDAFRDAEKMQRELQPKYPLLYSLAGVRHCDLLLSRGEHREAERRATQTLEWVMQRNLLLDIALDHLTLGRARLAAAVEARSGDLAEAADQLDRAVDGLRKAGQQDELPRGLLARAELNRLRGDFPGARRDLDEAYEIAERGGMRLFECDVHLECCRLLRAMGPQFDAAELAPGSPLAMFPDEGFHGHLAKAEQLVKQTGYHRRDDDLEQLRQLLE